MKKNVVSLALCALLAAPLPALAQSRSTATYGNNPHYTYVDGRLVLLEPDGGDRLDGVRIGGSVEFQPNLFGVGSLTTVGDSGYDLTQIDLGIGMSHALSGTMDLVGIVGIVLAEVEAGPFDDNDTGISLAGGVRAEVGPQFELGGYMRYAETFGDGDITLIGEGLLHVTRDLSLAASLGISDDYDELTLGARWNFR